jgi:repressor LexA
MSEYIDFNVNHYVKVKLTERGFEELKRQGDELKKQYPRISCEFKPPAVDEDGYSKFQLHDLMWRFGHLCGICSTQPFNSNIKIEVK